MGDMDIAVKLAEIITPIRLKILRTILNEKHPESLAKDFNITRQAMDKHLSILHAYGLVEKIIKYEGRPRVYYRITEEGEDMLRNFESVANNFLMDLRNRYKEELFTLDRMLVNGEIRELEYRKKKISLEKRFGWVTRNDN